MGYIPDSTTRTLTAYLTQKGREYLVAGDKDGMTIKYFALGDPDADYLVASQPGQTTPFNMLKSGFIPDLSGKNDGAIHSIAGGINQRFFISGGKAVNQLGTDLNFNTPRNVVRFQNISANVPLLKTTAGFQQLTFTFPIEVVGGGTSGYESVRIYLMPPSQGTSQEIYSLLTADNGNGGIYGWGTGSPFAQQVTATLSTTSLTPGHYNYVAKFRIAPYKSAVTIDPNKNVFTVNITLDYPGASSGSGSVGFGFNS